MVAYTGSPVFDPDQLSYVKVASGTITSNWATYTSAGDELVIDYTNKRLALVRVGNLPTDGVTIKCVYSKLKEVWRTDTDLIKFPFPMGPITDEQFELINGWDWDKTNTSGTATQTTLELLRTGGWSVVDTSGNITEQYAGIITLGTFVDDTDQAYIQKANAGQFTSSVNIKLTNPVNQAVKILDFVGTATAGSSSGTTATITVANSLQAGDKVFISGATPAGYNGTYTVVTANGTSFTITTTGSNIGPMTVMGRVYYDYRSYFKIFVREQGKIYAQSSIGDIGVSQLTYQAYRFPLSNATDLKIDNSDGLINGATPSGLSWAGGTATVTFASAHGFADGDSVIIAGVTPSGYNGTYTITTTGPTSTTFTYTVSDPSGSSTIHGTAKGANTDSVYSKINITYLRDANNALYNIRGTVVASTAYVVGDVVQEDKTAPARWYKCTVAGTPTNTSGTSKSSWTGTGTFVAYEGEREIGTNNWYAFNFIVDADTDVASTSSGDALRAQVYEKVQWFLRQNSDIDASGGIGSAPTVIGKTADALLRFVGDTMITSTGVYVDSFNTLDKNDIEFFDYSGTQRLFPYVATLTLNFNDNLKNDTSAKYWVFFTTTPGGNNFGEIDALVVNSVTQGATQGDATMTGTIGGNTSVLLDFDYDNNTQGSRTVGVADVTAVAIGLSTGQYVKQTGQIAKSKTNSISLVAPLERNYANPT